MNDWNQRYDTEDFLFGVDPAPFVPRHAPRLAPSSHVLAVADGEGRNSVWLARQGHKVTAFDISPNALNKAQLLADKYDVLPEFLHCGLEDFAWGTRTFDAIAAIFIQFVPPDKWPDLFKNFDRTLAPGGLVMMHGFAPRQVDYGTGGPPFRDNMYTVPMLQKAFAHYETLYAADYDEVIASGAAHGGRAGLIDFVARKPRH